MAARGYEFYLRVLIDTDEFPTEKTPFFFIHFRNNKIVQLKWSPIAKCLSQKCYETRIYSYKGEIKTIIFIFSVPKSQNSNEVEKNSITEKAYFKIASRCEFFATVTFNNESPLLTPRVNFWTLYFIFCGSQVNFKDAFNYVISVKHRMEPILIEGIHIRGR